MDLQFLVASGAIIPIGLGLLFAFSNGFRDSSTIVATVVSTRALSPGWAFLLCALFEFVGAFLIGSVVASTIGGSLLGKALNGSSHEIVLVLEAGLAAAFIWGVISWWRAWPTSNNQALVSGLFGASVAAWGLGHLFNGVIFFVFIILVLSPLIGFVISSVLNMGIRKAGEWMTPKVKKITESLHVLACLFVSTAHGSNDGQLVIGALGALMGSLHLVSPISWSHDTGFPIAIRLSVAVAISSGVLLGGRRILHKLGMKFFRIRDTEGLGAQLSSVVTIVACNMTGFPVSTTQVIAGSIVGAGVAKNPRAVRWHIVREIVLSWVLTLPSVALLAYLLCQMLKGVAKI